MKTKNLLSTEAFLSYIKKSKISIYIIIFFVLLTYGQRLINNSFSMDTEFYIHDFKGIYNAFDYLSRSSLKIINQTLGLSHLVPYVNTFLTITLITLYSIFFNYLFYINFGDKYKEAFIKFQFVFPIIFFTSPIFAEQYNFLFQNVGISIGILLIPISLLLLETVFEKKKLLSKILLLVISVILMGFSFTIYQSIILLFILATVSVYFIKTSFSEKTKNNYKYILLSILIFCGGLVLYYISSKYTGASNDYLQYCWGNQGFEICTRNILYVVQEMLSCQGLFYTNAYIFSLVLLGGIVLHQLIKKHLNFEFLISVIGLILSPFLIMIATGVDQLYRTQFNYPFFIGFIFLSSIIIVSQKTNLTKFLSYALIFVALIIGYKQAYLSATLFYSDEIRFQNDVRTGNRIQTILDSKDWYNPNEEYTLIFVGGYDIKPNTFLQEGEVMGYSFFEFDYPYIYGPSQRANIFMETLGYHNYSPPSLEQFNDAKEYVYNNNIPIFPSKESIILRENTIIVRLSEQLD